MAATNVQVFSGDVEVASNINVSNIIASTNKSSNLFITNNDGQMEMIAGPIRINQSTDKKITNPTGLSANDAFGIATSVSGDTLVTGAFGISSFKGYAFVYTRDTPGDPTSGWSYYHPTTLLAASDGSTGDRFGSAVSLDGDTVVIGAVSSNGDDGGAYVFTRNTLNDVDSAWTERANFNGSNGSNESFGASVSIQGDTMVIGAPETLPGLKGKAYVFRRDTPGDRTSGWTVVGSAALTASDGVNGDSFGSGVAIDGDTIVIGAPGTADAYVFRRDTPGDTTSTWTEVTKLTHSGIQASNFFGQNNISLDGDLVLIGAAPTQVGANAGQGVAYIFRRNTPGLLTSAWTFVQVLTGSDGAASDLFGQSCSLDGDKLVVGARGADAAYVFRRDTLGDTTSTWTQDTNILAPFGGVTGGYYGYAVSLDNNTIAVGAPFTDSVVGVQYVYEDRVDSIVAKGSITATSFSGDGSALTGVFSPAVDTIAIGNGAGTTSQGANSIAIGHDAGQTSQGDYAVAVGREAGQTSQGTLATAVGHRAGDTSQGASATAVGTYSGQYNQGANAVAMGDQAGTVSQGANSVALGSSAGYTGQAARSVAIGWLAGCSNQSTDSVAIGYRAGQSNQAGSCVAIGNEAGFITQEAGCIGVGYRAGRQAQKNAAAALGYSAGYKNQEDASIALGYLAGCSNQGTRSVAIGYLAGRVSQPSNSFYTYYGGVRGLAGTVNNLYISTTGEIQKQTSDDRLKHDEKFITGAVKSLSKLRPQEYFKRQILDANVTPQQWTYEAGLMAQEVYYSAPELRHIVQIPPEAGDIDNYTPPPSDDPTQDPDYSMWGNSPSTVDYTQLISYLIKAVQEIVTELPRSKTTVSNTWGQNITGLVVSADTNTHKTNTVPIVTLSNVYMDKQWYGVVSDETTDTNDYDTLVDTKGDTQIWVTDIGGPLESGDLLITSNVSQGFTQKQSDDIVRNYTVAKVTQDCGFTTPIQRAIKVPRRELSNVTYYRHDASWNTGIEEYEELVDSKKTTSEEPIYFKEVAEDSEDRDETRYYQGDVEVSEKKYNTLPEDDRTIKYLSEIEPAEYNLLDVEDRATYSPGTRIRYKVKEYSQSRNPLPQHDEEIVIEELVDVLDENGQIVWEDTSNTVPAYTLVDHGTYKAALVTCKLI